MKKLILTLFTLSAFVCNGRIEKSKNEESLIRKILTDPSSEEIQEVLFELKKQDLSPKNVVIQDSILLSNTNTLYILSHKVHGNKHYGAVIIPNRNDIKKLPVIIFATGGDGMHNQFDITQDFNHNAAQFPSFLGEELDKKFIVVIPSFRGQQMIIDDKKYQSEGNVGDAFDGATTDALSFLNVSIKTFSQIDENLIAIYGGSRGGTVALLASSRDKRIQRAIVVATPTDMKKLYLLYSEQFKLLFFNDLLIGKITEKEARKKFISISPIHFIKQLPMVQLHHDKNDPFVPVEFAKILVENMKANKKPVDSYFYDEGIHGFWNDENYWKRVQDFIRPLLD
ncbi:alpha/beta hydrolase family protein [Flavivirga rizhaonensis]|nr:prolyl oligopeptidase family serine peptidase [Flavivirga rizhaonensis]